MLKELKAEVSTFAESKPVSAKDERSPPVRSFPPHLAHNEFIHEQLPGSGNCSDCCGQLHRLRVDSDVMLHVRRLHWRVFRCGVPVLNPDPCGDRCKAIYATLTNPA